MTERNNGIFPEPDSSNTIISGNPTQRKEIQKHEEAKRSPEHSTSPPDSKKSIIRMSKSAGPEALDDAYLPIQAINMTNSDWIILAKVTNKSQIRKYHNEKGSGQLFNIELTDRHGSQIQATAFNTTVDALYEKIEPGKIYKISGCQVRIANRKFSSIDNDYCLFLNDYSRFDLAEDQGVDIADVQITKTPIAELLNLGLGKIVDLVGIVIRDEGTREIQTKNGERKIRNLVVIDNSRKEEMEEGESVAVNVNIWGEEPENLPIQENNLIIIKRCRTSEFRGGTNLNCSETDEFYFLKDVRKIKELILVARWFKDFSKNHPDFENNVINISTSGEESSGSSLPTKLLIQGLYEDSELFYCYGHIEIVRCDDKSVYPACPDCKKKVEKTLEEDWHCEKCCKDFKSPNFTYILSFKFTEGFSHKEYMGNQWLNCFREQGESLLGGYKAEEYYQSIKNEHTSNEEMNDLFHSLGKECTFKRFKILIKRSESEYQGEMKKRYTAIKIFEDPVQRENDFLIKTLNQYIEKDDSLVEKIRRL